MFDVDMLKMKELLATPERAEIMKKNGMSNMGLTGYIWDKGNKRITFIPLLCVMLKETIVPKINIKRIDKKNAF